MRVRPQHVLRRVAWSGSWGPGGAFGAEGLGPFGIAAMRLQVLGAACFPRPPGAPRGEGGNAIAKRFSNILGLNVGPAVQRLCDAAKPSAPCAPKGGFPGEAPGESARGSRGNNVAKMSPLRDSPAESPGGGPRERAPTKRIVGRTQTVEKRCQIANVLKTLNKTCS